MGPESEKPRRAVTGSWAAVAGADIDLGGEGEEVEGLEATAVGSVVASAGGGLATYDSQGTYPSSCIAEFRTSFLTRKNSLQQEVRRTNGCSGLLVT